MVLERMSTGVQAIDELLGGGIPQGATLLVTGTPGSGKTIFAHQMMFANATSESKVIYLTTLAEPLVKVMKFQQQFGFFDIKKVHSSVFYRDLGCILRKHGPSRVLAEVDKLLRDYEPALVVIDTAKSFSEMIPSLVEYREFLLDLSLRLTTWECTTLLLAEYAEGEIEARAESSIADGIIHLSGTEEKKQQKRLMRIIKMRGVGYTGGQNAFRITNDGIEVFPRISPQRYAHNSKPDLTRIPVGISGLDDMLGGGLQRDTTTLVSGSSGTGKTLLALQFVYAGLMSGEPAVYVTFEENPAQLINTAVNLNLDIEPYLKTGQLQLMHVSPMELDIDEYVHLLHCLVQKAGATRLVIDSISSFELGIADKPKYTDHIWALAHSFKSLGVSLLLTHELHDTYVSELTKHGVSYVADNIILLKYVEQGLDVKRCLRVVKVRGSNHSTALREICIGENGLIVLST